MTTEKERYSYSGPVMQFGRKVADFSAWTQAESLKKARNNILFQFKKKYGYVASTNFVLAGKLVKEE